MAFGLKASGPTFQTNKLERLENRGVSEPYKFRKHPKNRRFFPKINGLSYLFSFILRRYLNTAKMQSPLMTSQMTTMKDSATAHKPKVSSLPTGSGNMFSSHTVKF